MSAAAEGDAPQTQDPVESVRRFEDILRDGSCRLMKLADFNGDEGQWNGRQCTATVKDVVIRISAFDEYRIGVWGTDDGLIHFSIVITRCEDQDEIFMHNIKFIKKKYLSMSRIKGARASGGKRAREA